ncbi:MAG TPA: tRNA (adenosine(37)-N6)-threonylcarbamoyltransferase complex ATPase subunit type 1 TsaE [Spirochaetota bacterium]|jgi:tRNA threonylcarbamoyladenosine biosynthesis protein TsaE|nr:MAG: tRNA threonylcarbamoyladenosine biosynthesis protein TsaE [Spirochaetes bacterium ADurb.Bin133]HNZ27505.1 tRNA (adenosine(37)-N6)-threonylcarbamoyltransferase complex ATPase subunit type 1 TsaE [Spirochaetota bacterium]HPY88484.1 tRNA (adenosine(37)-N6)-threonylcarbamoyltransferase complex ATPase subunit type 1 TsaE [Spirochaetota bacterium]HQB60455.1 tRNA (adenosine(37)-N6)-threonylcarbamoyltransferase complex ATPase subunit type 1 TsaE [Spirochaetota bacterium]
MVYYSNSESETWAIGKLISEKIKPGDKILLDGEIGAGKSVLARGIAGGLGVAEPMPSPTFTLVNEYDAKYKIYHFDFYRLKDPYELYEIGFEDYVYSQGVSLIEWYSKGGDLIPNESILISIKIESDNKRKIEINWTR